MPGARLRALLIALAHEPGRPVQRATLVDWIWGEHPPSDATNALQRLVSRLRKVLPDGAVEAQPNGSWPRSATGRWSWSWTTAST
ncbi:AfsR/SARP family transcriptional regulator [Promicromonospora panici]|uniref:AfsR/SARP family transcriptional regulator n=1 Tax=Promicromonospora panici TaxID=2219658 RepID=UPI001A91134F|nr:helix-turn-helix domain-containing protein [Promicromonospora panici]